MRPRRSAAAFGVLLGLAAAPALSQEMADATRMDLWCGLALTLVAEGAPGDATEEQKALAARFAEGGLMLTDRAKALLLESGFSDDQLAAQVETMGADADAAVNRADTEPAYSFEECAALLPL